MYAASASMPSASRRPRGYVLILDNPEPGFFGSAIERVRCLVALYFFSLNNIHQAQYDLFSKIMPRTPLTTGYPAGGVGSDARSVNTVILSPSGSTSSTNAYCRAGHDSMVSWQPLEETSRLCFNHT